MLIWIFIALFITHAAALYAGWRMGREVQNPYLYIPHPDETPRPDIYEEERLDVS